MNKLEKFLKDFKEKYRQDIKEFIYIVGGCAILFLVIGIVLDFLVKRSLMNG